MKKSKKIISLFLVAISVFSIFNIFLTTKIKGVEENKTEGEIVKGVWIASVFNIDFPSKTNLSEKEMRKELDTIVTNSKNQGFNTIFFQVQPTADALYKSSYLPWSKWLTGTQGKAPENNFDPLTYIIEKAHNENIKLHAWINPYRISSSNNDTNSLSQDHIARKNPKYVLKYGKGMYFNPGEPEVRELLNNVVKELCSNYNIDGIHMDDYFYPYKEYENGKELPIDDSEVYKKYGNGQTVDDFRRNNVNELVKSLKDTIKGINKNIQFGISPFGVWANKSHNSLGSETKGMESYYEIYSDSRKWVKENLVDYITPQLYWNINHNLCPYKTLVDWWNDVCTGTNVKLYIGHGAYKLGESTFGNYNEIINQIDYAKNKGSYGGSCFYGYDEILNNKGGIKEPLKNYLNNFVYTDVKSNYWGLESILFCHEKGLMKGKSNTKFEPLSNLTRAEFAQIIYNKYKDDNTLKESTYERYKDIKETSWYYDAVDFASKIGAFKGHNGYFRPNDNITRQEIAIAMMRFIYGENEISKMDVKAVEQSLIKDGKMPKDIKDVSDFAYLYTLKAFETGLFNGDNLGYFNPKNNIIRGESAQVLYNYFKE